MASLLPCFFSNVTGSLKNNVYWCFLTSCFQSLYLIIVCICILMVSAVTSHALQTSVYWETTLPRHALMNPTPPSWLFLLSSRLQSCLHMLINLLSPQLCIDSVLYSNSSSVLGAGVRHSAHGKGHEEGGATYAKVGWSLRSPPGNPRASTPITRACLPHYFVLSPTPLTLRGAVPHHLFRRRS